MTGCAVACEGCRAGEALDFDFTMAFQPIVDLSTGGIYAHEALAAGWWARALPKSWGK